MQRRQRDDDPEVDHDGFGPARAGTQERGQFIDGPQPSVAMLGCGCHSFAMRGHHLPLTPDWRLWALSGIVAVIDAIWLPQSRLTINSPAFFMSAAIGMFCLLWHYAGRFIRMHDGPRMFAAGLAFILLASKSTSVFGELVMTLPVPMADSLLARWDRALGLDWMGYLSWVEARSWLSQVLLWVYYGILPVSFFAFAVLHFSNRRERASEYLALSFICGMVAMVVGAAFPALGTVTHFQVPHALMAAFPARTGAQWVQRLTELRSGLPVDISGFVGLVSFPSYHVALTIIIAWCFRGFRIAFPICVIYALGTVASAPIIGGHYFVDLIAGAALVCIVIAAGALRRALAIASAMADVRSAPLRTGGRQPKTTGSHTPY